MSRHPDVVAGVIDSARKRRATDRPVLHAELTALQKEMETIQRKAANVADVLMNGGVESMNDTLRQRIAEINSERQRLTVSLERKRRELAACDAAILDEKRVLRALDRLSELLTKLPATE